MARPIGQRIVVAVYRETHRRQLSPAVPIGRHDLCNGALQPHLAAGSSRLAARRCRDFRYGPSCRRSDPPRSASCAVHTDRRRTRTHPSHQHFLEWRMAAMAGSVRPRARPQPRSAMGGFERTSITLKGRSRVIQQRFARSLSLRGPRDSLDGLRWRRRKCSRLGASDRPLRAG